MVAKVERAAAVRQPAHDDLVAGQHLLAVDAQVLPRLVRPLGDDQAPGDERRHVAGPAVLDRQPGQVDVSAFPNDLLARRAAQFLGRHAPQRFDQAAHADQFLETLGRLGLLERGQHMAKLAQLAHVIDAHAQSDAARGAKQVAQHRNVMAGGVLEQQGRAASAQRAVAQGGHLQMRRNLGLDALELAQLFELGDEVSEVAVGHAGLNASRRSTLRGASRRGNPGRRRSWIASLRSQ